MVRAGSRSLVEEESLTGKMQFDTRPGIRCIGRIADCRIGVVRAPGPCPTGPRPRIARIPHHRTDRFGVDRRNVISLGERIGDHLPVRLQPGTEAHRTCGIGVGQAVVFLAKRAEEFRQRHFRFPLQIDEDPPVPYIAGDRCKTTPRLVETEEIRLVGHADQRAIVAVGPVVIAAYQPRCRTSVS